MYTLVNTVSRGKVFCGGSFQVQCKVIDLLSSKQVILSTNSIKTIFIPIRCSITYVKLFKFSKRGGNVYMGFSFCIHGGAFSTRKTKFGKTSKIASFKASH